MSNTVVRTNVLAINSHRSLKTVGAQQSKSSARLSSGYKINSAADDASGLAISEKMRAQIRGLDQASVNAQDAISLIQTAEGGMQEIDNMVQRIRELVVKAANDTNEVDGTSAATIESGDRQKVQDEINALVEEIDSMKERVEFNGKRLINGSFDDKYTTIPADGSAGVKGTVLHFQVGANAGQSMELTIGSVDTKNLGLGDGKGTADKAALGNVYDSLTGAAGTGTGVTATGGTNNTLKGLTGLLDTLDNALTVVTKQRSKLGAAQNRLEYTMRSLDVSSENLSASESRIRDTDMAKEMMSLTQANVLQQASTSMLAQANQAPQAVLQLLQ